MPTSDEFSEDSRSLFFRGQLRYYLNRERRFEKNRSLRNNAGSYIAYQTRFLFNGGIHGYNVVGKVWHNEIHFGQQLPLGKRFTFRYRLGVGHAFDVDYNNHAIYPAVGFAFGFAI